MGFIRVIHLYSSHLFYSLDAIIVALFPSSQNEATIIYSTWLIANPTSTS